MQSCVGWAFQIEDSSYQGLEDRSVYVRPQVQSEASVAAANQVEGTLRPEERRKS